MFLEHPTVQGFRSAITEHPTDPFHWLVLADWLEENNEIVLANRCRQLVELRTAAKAAADLADEELLYQPKRDDVDHNLHHILNYPGPVLVNSAIMLAMIMRYTTADGSRSVLTYESLYEDAVNMAEAKWIGLPADFFVRPNVVHRGTPQDLYHAMWMMWINQSHPRNAQFHPAVTDRAFANFCNIVSGQSTGFDGTIVNICRDITHVLYNEHRLNIFPTSRSSKIRIRAIMIRIAQSLTPVLFQRS